MVQGTTEETPAGPLGIRALRGWNIDCVAAIAGFCAVPLSIAVSETFLVIALLARVVAIVRGSPLNLPRVCWWWLGWAGLEVVGWLRSPQPRAGLGEMRHLLLIAAVFVILPCLNRPACKLAVWRGLFLTSTVGAGALLINTIMRMVTFGGVIAAHGDAEFYLRNGGFLHHWMIFATVEVLIFGALLEFRFRFPRERSWATPALGFHCLAILFSLTRILWIAAFVLTAVHLLWRRSRWIFALPVFVFVAFLIAPDAVRTRIADSSHLDYYSNSERLQMWQVGYKMIREHPVFGVGPGLVEDSYANYLPQGEALPAYHGHLHNNGLQLAAQFGLPVLFAAVSWLAFLLLELRRGRAARAEEERFLRDSSFLGILGF